MRLLSIVFTATVLMTSCMNTKGPKASAPLTPPPPPTWEQLTGKAFSLTTLTTKGKVISVPDNRRPTIEFTGSNKIAGNAGVNRYTGTATLGSGGSLTVGADMITTKMAGEPDLMQLEQEFIRVLQSARRVRLNENRLSISDETETSMAEFSR